MVAIVDAVAIGGLTWATLTFNKVAFQTALNILTHDSDIGYFKLGIRGLKKQLAGQTGGEDKEKDERTCTCGERETNESLNPKYTAHTHTMSDNKLVKSLLDAATITGLVAGIGWIGKKTIKENHGEQQNTHSPRTH